MQWKYPPILFCLFYYLLTFQLVSYAQNLRFSIYSHVRITCGFTISAITFFFLLFIFLLLQKFSSTVASSGCLRSLINLWKAHVCLSHYFMMMCPRFGIITHRDRATFCTSIGWMGNGRAGNCRSILLLYITWILFCFFYLLFLLLLFRLFACFIRLRAIVYAMGSSFAIIYSLDSFICNRANEWCNDLWSCHIFGGVWLWEGTTIWWLHLVGRQFELNYVVILFSDFHLDSC